MQDFNHATNPNQHAMTPEQAAAFVRHADLVRAVGAVDVAINVINLQQPEPAVTEVFQPTTSAPDLNRIIDINQRIQAIRAQEAAAPIVAQPTAAPVETRSLADRFKEANQPAQNVSSLEDLSNVA